MLKVDIGDQCTHCGDNTAFGTGLFVNRIPSGTDGILVLTGGNADVRISVQVDGYMCADCQQDEDDKEFDDSDVDCFYNDEEGGA